MNPVLTVFHEIISGGLKPWVQGETSDAKYNLLASETTKPTPLFENRYDFKFLSPYNSKTNYYHNLIEGASVNFLNELTELFNQSRSENIRTNLIYNSLKKELWPLLIRISKVIASEKFDARYIDIKNFIKSDSEIKDGTYVFHALKAYSIWLYLEIQQLGKSYLQSDVLSPDEIFFQVFEEQSPGFYAYHANSKIATPSPEIKSTGKEDQKEEAYSFKLHNYVREHSKLKLVYDSLKLNGFIDKATKTTQFKKIFSGEYIDEPVIWTGTKTDLAFFVKRLHNDLHLVAGIAPDHWKVTAKCFVQSDGTYWPFTAFRQLKTSARAEEINTALDNLS
ncbi:hypothetical protein [Fulvivirga sp.]|uniref:hypothetical protein n=1 Tax=Fulvivirga sp. TaxID=1931237 RepID=UPI0032EF6485